MRPTLLFDSTATACVFAGILRKILVSQAALLLAFLAVLPRPSVALSLLESPSSEADFAQLRAMTRQTYLRDNALLPSPVVEDSPYQTFSWTEQEFAVSDGTEFGRSVAIYDATAFVGAVATNSFQGAVYVYARSLCIQKPCAWTQKQRLVASDGVAGAEFGSSVAFDGTTALIGSMGATVGGHSNQGAAYVFTRDSSQNFAQVQELTAPDGAAEDCFGASVTVVGMGALVGAPFCNGTNNVLNGHGSAYRYSRDANDTWTIAQKLVASDGGFAESFGGSVGISSDTAMVGADSAFQYGNYGVGAVYVFSKQCFTGGCNPGWLETQKLVASDPSTFMSFGGSVAFDGTTLLVGSPYALVGQPPNDHQNQGTAYVFTKSGSSWVQSAEFIASNGHTDQVFGSSVALSGANAVVGATHDGWPSPNNGGAFEFTRNGSGVWAQVQHFTASDATGNDDYGNSVGVSATNTVLIGALGAPNNSGQGRAYLYQP